MKRLLFLVVLLFGNACYAGSDLADRVKHHWQGLVNAYAYMGKMQNIPEKDLKKIAFELEKDLFELELIVFKRNHPYSEYTKLLNNYKLLLSDLSILNNRRKGASVLKEDDLYALQDRVRVKEDILHLAIDLDLLSRALFPEEYKN